MTATDESPEPRDATESPAAAPADAAEAPGADRRADAGAPQSADAPSSAVEPQSAKELISGLRNPGAAVRGVGAGTLVLEFLVLLLAIQPLRTVLSNGTGQAAGLAAGLAFVCLIAAGLLRYRWAWMAVTVLQVVIIATGIVHWMLAAVGIIFLLVWLYVLNVRRSILG